MIWTKSCRCLAKINKNNRDISAFSAWSYASNKRQNGFLGSEKVQTLHGLKPQRGCQPATLLQQDGSVARCMDFQERIMFSRNVFSRSKIPCFGRDSLWSKQSMKTVSRQFGHSVENDPHLNRNFLAQLWVVDRKIENDRRKRIRRRLKLESYGETVHDTSFAKLFRRSISGASVTEEKSYEQGEPVITQPPPSQPVAGFLSPTSAEEAKIAPLLARSNLLITREIELANLTIGFQQENRYAIVDVCYPKSPVGHIREESFVLARQLLRLRRPFFAYVTDGMHNELFKVRRPFWWITSSIYVEVNGKEIGVVHRRWHLWRRVYDLYLGNKQFAVVENPGFWNWTFTLKDINGEVLAEIDRDWRGFGFEIFTDAGQYVIRFGRSDPSSKIGDASVVQDLEVFRPLTLSERAITVALAISLDNDYFSRHGGWGLPLIAMTE